LVLLEYNLESRAPVRVEVSLPVMLLLTLLPLLLELLPGAAGL
jgi:hypothetical protein